MNADETARTLFSGSAPALHVVEVVLCDGQPWARPVGTVAQPAAVRGAEVDVAEGDLWLADSGDSWVLRSLLARRGSVRAELVRAAMSLELPFAHSSAAIEEARGCLQATGIDDPTLVDLTHVPFVTIDNDDSRDLDQAVHIDARHDGFVVRYALADASYYVAPGSALFAEALARGASYYLPGLSLPMLPRALSEGLVSLNAGEARRALVFEMSLDAMGRGLETRVFRGRIRSVAKLSYRGVQAYFDARPAHWMEAQPYARSLQLLEEVGRLRLREARARNVVQFARVELELEPSDPEGMRFEMVGTHRLEVERYNEQISLLCNVEGARWLAAYADAPHVQPVFRAHPAPPPERLAQLSTMIDALVQAHGLDPATWSWRRVAGEHGAAESLADYLERLPGGDSVGAVRAAIERQALLVNQRSTFQSAPEVHFGVGAEAYARFSAPMREIVGIFTHKEAIDLLEGRGAGLDPTSDETLRERVILAGNRAKDAQRALTKLCNKVVLDRIFEADLALALRPWRPGVVLGLTRTRLYVQLDDPPVEVKVYAEHLAQDDEVRWEVDDSEVALTMRGGTTPRAYRLGERVRVAVAGHDDQKGRWRFDVEPLRQATP